MCRVVRLLAVGVFCLGLSASASAQQVIAPRVFTVVGSRSASAPAPHDGATATAVALQPKRIAAAPDGSLVVVDYAERAWRVDPGGRLQRIARYMTDVTVGPDGTIYLSDGDNSTIVRVAPDGSLVRFAGRPQSFLNVCAEDGDRSPALNARICPNRIAAGPEGLLMLSERTVRLVGSDEIVRRIVGNGHSGHTINGAAATASPLNLDDYNLGDLSAAPNGAPIISDKDGVWTVTPEGRLRQLVRTSEQYGPAEAADMLANGDLLIAGGGSYLWLRSSGRHKELVSPERPNWLWTAFDGDAGPLSHAIAQPRDLAVDRDGGWLLASLGYLRYVPPTAPQRLAVGLADKTVSPQLPVTAVVETTRPARLTVKLSIRGRQQGTTTVDRPAGRWHISVPGGRTGALNIVSVKAVSTDPVAQVATDRVGVIPGHTLPMAVARRLTHLSVQQMQSIGGSTSNTVSTCRRMSAARVDCSDFDVGFCEEITAYRLRPDGILTGRDYNYDRDKCRFQAHPRWHYAIYGVELPAD